MTNEENILARIREGVVTFREICNHADLANRVVDNALRRLKNRGVIRFDRRSTGLKARWVRNEVSPRPGVPGVADPADS